MCQAGINSTDYKLAIHQLTEHARLLKINAEQWAMMADSMHEHELAHRIQDAGSKVAEVILLFEEAIEDVREHTHTQIHLH